MSTTTRKTTTTARQAPAKTAASAVAAPAVEEQDQAVIDDPRCRVPDCVPGVHGPIERGLCPIHQQTHPGLAAEEDHGDDDA